MCISRLLSKIQGWYFWLIKRLISIFYTNVFFSEPFNVGFLCFLFQTVLLLFDVIVLVIYQFYIQIFVNWLVFRKKIFFIATFFQQFIHLTSYVCIPSPIYKVVYLTVVSSFLKTKFSYTLVDVFRSVRPYETVRFFFVSFCMLELTYRLQTFKHDNFGIFNSSVISLFLDRLQYYFFFGLEI